MKTNLACKLLAVAMLATCAAACVSTPPPRHFAPGQWVSENRDQLQATGIVLARIAARDALTIALSSAVSDMDWHTKLGITQGLSTALRSKEGSLVTADDVRAVIAAWTPAKSHWEEVGLTLAQPFLAAPPQTVAQAKAMLESAALTLAASTTPTQP